MGFFAIRIRFNHNKNLFDFKLFVIALSSGDLETKKVQPGRPHLKNIDLAPNYLGAPKYFVSPAAPLSLPTDKNCVSVILSEMRSLSYATRPVPCAINVPVPPLELSTLMIPILKFLKVLPSLVADMMIANMADLVPEVDFTFP
jgi:hypothetical protein